jgi:hypothetical protein
MSCIHFSLEQANAALQRAEPRSRWRCQSYLSSLTFTVASYANSPGMVMVNLISVLKIAWAFDVAIEDLVEILEEYGRCRTQVGQGNQRNILLDDGDRFIRQGKVRRQSRQISAHPTKEGC